MEGDSPKFPSTLHNPRNRKHRNVSSIFLDKGSRAIKQKHRHAVLFSIGSRRPFSFNKCLKENKGK